MKLLVTASSKTGCVRGNNEDMVLVEHIFVRNGKASAEIEMDSADRCLLALADGMGGHSCGEVASSDVLHNLQYYFYDLPVGLSIGDFNETIYEWLKSINNIIDSKSRNENRYKRMGTTLVVLASYGGEYYWMNCGDSRVYRLHESHLKQLSTDHSLSNYLGGTERTNVITNCIGGGCKSSFIDIKHCTADFKPGDVFMLCSDGLTDMLSDSQIEQLINDGCNAEDLCLAAENAGGYDNVSVLLARVS